VETVPNDIHMENPLHTRERAAGKTDSHRPPKRAAPPAAEPPPTRHKTADRTSLALNQFTLLRGTSSAQRARFKLAIFSKRKKSYAAQGLTCAFCSHRFHTIDFCPSLGSEETDHKVPFVERLLNLPREDTATLENVDIKEAMRITEQRGEELNRDNPWADSTARKDKLRARLGFWKAIGTDRHTLSWLAYGKKLSFITPPENLSFPNHPSTRPHDAFIAEEAEKGLADGSFFRAHHSFARVINPTQIEPKGKGKLRYCHDIRYPNSLTATAPFRLSTLARNLHTVLLDGDLLVVSDLEKAYYSVPMHPDSWPYLCFDTPIGLMAGTCLLFGDAQAPFTFHKITRHIVAFAGRLGVRVLSYLDDFLWMAQPNKIAQTSAFAQWILPLLGWSLNQKCDFTPSTFKKFLGFYVDSEAMRLKAPFRKVRETSRMIRDTITTGAATVKHLQSIAGKIISLRLAIPGTRAWTRSTNELIAKATREGQAGGEAVPITEAVARDWTFLLTHMEKWSTIGLPLPSATRDVIVNADTGEFGYGGHTTNLRPNIEHAGVLPEHCIGTSSTHREFYGLIRVAYHFRETLRGNKVLFRLDSRCLVCNLYKEGGRIPELVQMWKEWFAFCTEQGIEPYYEWLPREQNTWADKLSKRVPYHWTLSQIAQEVVEGAFPSHLGLQVIMPDLNQIANALATASLQGDAIVLIHPVWPAMAWWHYINTHSTRHTALPTADTTLRATRDGKTVVGPKRWNMRASLLAFQ
jgi:hypothetical protein